MSHKHDWSEHPIKEHKYINRNICIIWQEYFCWKCDATIAKCTKTRSRQWYYKEPNCPPCDWKQLYDDLSNEPPCLDY